MNQPTRKEVLDIINELIDEEMGIAVTEDSLLIDCEIDSFGYAMIWLGLNEKLSKYFEKPVFPNNEVDEYDYSTLSIKWILDKVDEEYVLGDKVRKESITL